VSDYIAANRAIWNAWTTHFATSAHYADATLVRAGGSSLRSIEREEVGAVRGRTLLHLQCNMGADTLSWARLGAQVTGVDIAICDLTRRRAAAILAPCPVARRASRSVSRHSACAMSAHILMEDRHEVAGSHSARGWCAGDYPWSRSPLQRIFPS
jgi:hypothetical protein